MVEHDVLHHFQAVGVGRFHKLLVLGVGAVARVNLVAVRYGVAVVAGLGMSFSTTGVGQMVVTPSFLK